MTSIASLTAPGSLARFAATPPAAPAPAAPACTADQGQQIDSLRRQAGACRRSGAVVGVGVGAMATMVGLGGSVTGAVLVGLIGFIGVATILTRAYDLEQQAAELERRCGTPAVSP